MPLLWIDLETTGLLPTEDRVLEIACILTDDALVEQWRCSVVTSEALRTNFTKLHPAAIKMHCDNGLWTESLTVPRHVFPESGAAPFSGERPIEVDHEGVDHWLYHNLLERGVPRPAHGESPTLVLAGTTVHFDRGFVREHFPKVDSLLSHRHLDVRAITELVSRTWPQLRAGEPRSNDGARAKHRAMPDIEHSLALARYYQSALRPRVMPNTDDVGDFGSHGQ